MFAAAGRGMTKWLITLLLTTTLLGCSAGAQKPAIASALDDPEMRRESFEATLQVLDEHPEYVDDLFAVARRHPKTLDRFLHQTGRELEQDEFARFTAQRLVAHPEGLKRTLIAALDEASDDPVALRAMSEAMAERPQLAAIVVVQTDASLRRVLHALLLEVLKNPEARRAFLAGVSENSDAMARIIVPNTQVLVLLVKAFARVGLAKGSKELEALARAVE
jgi:hypothetical protein